MERHAEVIFEPVDYYKSVLQAQHENNATNFINQLIETNNIDVNANKQLVQKINKLDNKLHKLTTQFHKIKSIATMLTVMIIVGVVLVIIGILGLLNLSAKPVSNPTMLGVFSCLLVLGLACIIGLSILKFKKFNKLLRQRDQEIHKLQVQRQQLIDQALAGLQALFDAFSSTDAVNIAKTTSPIIDLDEYFDKQKHAMLINKYKFKEFDQNNSIVGVQSGSLVGNPFIIYRRVRNKIENKVYQGSISVFVKRHYTDAQGHRHSQVISEVLTASVTKPAPVFEELQSLVYANEAVEHLTYSRVPMGINTMDDKQLEHFVKQKSKELNKKANEAIANGTSFNLMGNEEFESLFGALDRNDEIQFRMLFTPLAQKQMLGLLKDKQVGFGDDFTILKDKHLNYIKATNFARYNFNVSPSEFILHDLEAVKAKFISRNNNFFKHIYFALAPILSTPLYQQYKPAEYLYPFKFHNNPSVWENEAIANSYDQLAFAHPESTTQNILKTKVVEEQEDKYQLAVTAYGYRGEPRVDKITAMASDGRIHIVPVKWTEYFPVDKTSHLYVKKTATPLTNHEFQKRINDPQAWGKFISAKAITSNFSINRNRMFSFISSDIENLDELDMLK